MFQVTISAESGLHVFFGEVFWPVDLAMQVFQFQLRNRAAMQVFATYDTLLAIAASLPIVCLVLPPCAAFRKVSDINVVISTTGQSRQLWHVETDQILKQRLLIGCCTATPSNHIHHLPYKRACALRHMCQPFCVLL